MKRSLLEKTSLRSCNMLIALFAFTSFRATTISSGKLNAPATDHVESIIINKSFEKKNCNVEISANNEHSKLLIATKKPHKKTYQFYLFDIDGKLKAHTNIRGNEMTALVNISQGNYYFEIFDDDERIENGQVIVK